MRGVYFWLWGVGKGCLPPLRCNFFFSWGRPILEANIIFMGCYALQYVRSPTTPTLMNDVHEFEVGGWYVLS